MKRRLFCLLLAALLVAAALPYTARAVAKIDTVAVHDLTYPVQDAKPDFQASVAEDAGYTLHEAYTTEWYDETDKRYLAPTDTFMRDHIYTVTVYLQVKSGYEFATEGNVPKVTGTIFLDTAKVQKVFEYQAWYAVAVVYTFEPCPSRRIDKVDFTVDAPVAYKMPSFVPNSYDDECVLNKTHTHYTEGVTWWHDIPGMRRQMDRDDQFQAGDSYTVGLLVEPLWPTTGFAQNVEATINGKRAQVTWIDEKQIAISYQFTCKGSLRGSLINAVVTVPREGYYPDKDLYWQSCQQLTACTWVRWVDASTGSAVMPDEQFRSGGTYWIEFFLWVESGWEFEVDENGEFVYPPMINGSPADYYKIGADQYGRLCVELRKYFTVGNTGDMDGDGDKDTDDAVYLLLHVMFGAEDYPIANPDKDLNNDSKVDTDDAVYLLLHVMFGAEDYPI